MPDRLALVTGATSGIGRAFAGLLAGLGWNLLLVARDSARLDALCDVLGPKAEALPTDLSVTAQLNRVAARAQQEPLGLLINNAGLTLNTTFSRSTLESELYLLSVNVEAVLRLTHAALPGMQRRGAGGIINVSSITGFAATLPGSSYPASKAWVTQFSQALALTAKRDNVRVMALCPGYTRSEFHERAGIDVSRTAPWAWLSPDKVARVALRDLQRGRSVCIPGWRYKAVAAVMRHTPATLLSRLAALVQPPHGAVF